MKIPEHLKDRADLFARHYGFDTHTIKDVGLFPTGERGWAVSNASETDWFFIFEDGSVSSRGDYFLPDQKPE